MYILNTNTISKAQRLNYFIYNNVYMRLSTAYAIRPYFPNSLAHFKH